MFVLAAVQILPAWELSRYSDRVLPTHAATTTLFSVPCWRLVEFFWPNAGGIQFPVNARWFNAYGDDVWVPSFYMGLVPMLLAVWSLRFWSIRRRDVFLTFMLIFFVLGSLGQWGGVYPLLNLLPGYGMFRYPAKLLTVAALPLALLAARGFDRWLTSNQWFPNDRSTLRKVRPFLFLIGLFFAMLACHVVLYIFWANSKELNVPNCSLFGPYQYYIIDQKAVIEDMVFTYSQYVCAVVVFLPLTVIWREAKSLKNHNCLVVLLIALDIFFANRWMVATVPRRDFQEQSPLVELIHQRTGDFVAATGDKVPGSLFRIYRFPEWYPLVFSVCASPDRLSEIVRWERATLNPKYSLPERIGVVDVLGTTYPKEFYKIAGGLRWEILHGKPGDLEKRLEDLGVQFVVAPSSAELNADNIPLPAGWPSDCSLWKLRNPRPRNYAVFEPNRLELDVELSKPGTVTLAEQYFPGWQAFVDGKEIPIRCEDRVFRAVDLPAGKHRLRMVYQPRWFYVGAIISATGIIALIAWPSFPRKREPREQMSLCRIF